MPVNMDPTKKRRLAQATPDNSVQPADPVPPPTQPPTAFGEETPLDKEKDLADAEWKNLWDATEVIDMDKI
jgi:hypothetical protein